MEIALFIVIIIFFAAIAWRLWKPPARRRKKRIRNPCSCSKTRSNELTRTLEAKLGESAKAINDSTSKAFTQATESTRLIKRSRRSSRKLAKASARW